MQWSLCTEGFCFGYSPLRLTEVEGGIPCLVNSRADPFCTRTPQSLASLRRCACKHGLLCVCSFGQCRGGGARPRLLLLAAGSSRVISEDLPVAAPGRRAPHTASASQSSLSSALRDAPCRSVSAGCVRPTLTPRCSPARRRCRSGRVARARAGDFALWWRRRQRRWRHPLRASQCVTAAVQRMCSTLVSAHAAARVAGGA